MSDQQEQQFGIQRVYVKDISFESPQVPALFGKGWNPQAQQEISTSTQPLGDDRYEVTLKVTITGKMEAQPVFVVEVVQAGIFLAKGLQEDQLGHLLGSHCPSILFPYAREAIDSLMNRGTLPPLLLPPINFDAVYQQALTQQAGATAH